MDKNEFFEWAEKISKHMEVSSKVTKFRMKSIFRNLYIDELFQILKEDCTPFWVTPLILIHDGGPEENCFNFKHRLKFPWDEMII